MGRTTQMWWAPLQRWLCAVGDRYFERMERSRLAEVEQAVAGALNERDVSQRVHRIEPGAGSLTTF